MWNWRSETGQVLVVTSLSMMVLLGVMGLALDTGMLFHAKRTQQIAADAAAVAGALDFRYNADVDSAIAAGQAAAAQNGFTDGSNGITVSINIPPKYGETKGLNGYIEAIVQYPSPTYFMRLVGFNSVNMATRAVAGTGSTYACIWTLARSGADVSINGNGVLYTPHCSIYDDSAAANALVLTGGGNITAKSIGIVGSYSVSNNGTLTPTPKTGLAPAADPLASLPAPSASTDTCSGSNCNISISGNSSITLQPGTYSSISNSGGGTVTLASGNYTITGNVTSSSNGGIVFGPGNYTIGGKLSDSGSSSMTFGSGTYIVGGNLNLTGSGTISGTGVTFYTESSTSVAGGSNLSLTAPTTGTYSGVLLFQSRSDSSTLSIAGGSGTTVQGILYAPAASVTLSGGSSGVAMSLDVISDTLTVTGSGTFSNSNYAIEVNPNSVLSKTMLVE
ncbi:MAG TPA: pilus assembly protein TadG-related protein [Terracidiphilus sp.]|nr:pilus assembly protein TadG-related protein [Terracidiphilus sp.]